MNNKALIDERKRKSERIIEIYERDHRQEDVARELNIPLHIVKKVTKEYDYYQTKKVTPENVYKGQKIMMCRNFSSMGYLDKFSI